MRALPRVVALLTHEERAVRMAASQAMAEFGAASTPYLGELQRAADAESDSATQETMLGSIRVIIRAMK